MEQIHQDQRFTFNYDNGVYFLLSDLLPGYFNVSLHRTSFDLRPSSPHVPAAPPYNGSYQESSYSPAVELDFGLFDSDSFAVLSEGYYDPSEYDAPSSTSQFMFDHGLMSSVNNSNLVSVGDAHSPYYGPSRVIAASPHLDFNHSWQIHVTVDSPCYCPIPIPSEDASALPPFLDTPDLNQPGGYQHVQPVIHAPEGGGFDPSPRWPMPPIVPTTPVSGSETQAAGFRNTVFQGPYPWGSLFAEEFTERSPDRRISRPVIFPLGKLHGITGYLPICQHPAQLPSNKPVQRHYSCLPRRRLSSVSTSVETQPVQPPPIFNSVS